MSNSIFPSEYERERYARENSKCSPETLLAAIVHQEAVGNDETIRAQERSSEICDIFRHIFGIIFYVGAVGVVALFLFSTLGSMMSLPLTIIATLLAIVLSIGSMIFVALFDNKVKEIIAIVLATLSFIYLVLSIFLNSSILVYLFMILATVTTIYSLVFAIFQDHSFSRIDKRILCAFLKYIDTACGTFSALINLILFPVNALIFWVSGIINRCANARKDEMPDYSWARSTSLSYSEDFGDEVTAAASAFTENLETAAYIKGIFCDLFPDAASGCAIEVTISHKAINKTKITLPKEYNAGLTQQIGAVWGMVSLFYDWYTSINPTAISMKVEYEKQNGELVAIINVYQNNSNTSSSWYEAEVYKTEER